MSFYISINGRPQNKVDALSRSLHYGDSVFETLKLEEGQVRCFKAHFERFKAGALRLFLPTPNQSLYCQEIKHAITKSEQAKGVVKIIHARGGVARGYSFQESFEAALSIVIVSPQRSQLYEGRLGVCRSGYSPNPLLAGIKHGNRLEQILASHGLKENDGIMLDSGKWVISTTKANIFALYGETLMTPDLTRCGIDGVVRSMVLDLAQELGLRAKVGNIDMTQLLSADEVFITNSLIGVKPVSEIAGHIFTKVEKTTRIAHAFSKLEGEAL